MLCIAFIAFAGKHERNCFWTSLSEIHYMFKWEQYAQNFVIALSLLKITCTAFIFLYRDTQDIFLNAKILLTFYRHTNLRRDVQIPYCYFHLHLSIKSLADLNKWKFLVITNECLENWLLNLIKSLYIF